MGPLRALIVEDDPDIVDLVRSALEPKIECCVASNGLEGLQVVEVAQPDFAICDIMMPVMEGTEFIKRVRQIPSCEGLPVIFLSALSSPEHIKQGYALGVALYLTKPIDPLRLRRNLELFVKDHEIEPRARRFSIEEIHQFNQVHQEEITGKRAAPQPAPQAAPAPQPAPTAPPTPHTPAPTSTAPAPPAKPAQTAAGRDAMSLAMSSLQRVKALHQEESSRDRVRILIVEDDRDTCQLLRVGLGDHYDLLETNDGINAIEYSVRYQPDLFIIDGMLPRMTGYQLAVMLKKNRDFWRSPIIFISGKASQRDQLYIQKLGITQFIAKPFTVAMIQAAVRDIVDLPGFVQRHDRLPFSQVHMELFQNYETHRSQITLDHINRQGVESALKKQLH